MENLPVNAFDLGVVVIIGLAALVGLASGFIKGGLYLVSWAGAGFATLYGFPYARPYANDFIKTPWLADLAAGIAVFLIALIVLTLISSLIGSWVRNSRLNAVDRSLGMFAGVIAAIVILCGAYTLLGGIWPEDRRPAWVKDARSIPLLEEGGQKLRGLIPGESASLGEKALRDAQDRATKAMDAQETLRNFLEPTPKPVKKGTADGAYSESERREMERLIEGSR